MNKKILALSMFLSISSLWANESIQQDQPSMIPLKEYIKNKNIQNDDGAKGYMALRCGCLYLVTSTMMEGKNEDKNKKENILMCEGYKSQAVLLWVMAGKSMGVKIDNMVKNIGEITAFYIEDSNKNYQRTGNMMVDSYMGDDLIICKEFVEKNSKYLNIK